MRKLCAHAGCKAVVDVDPASKETALCLVHYKPTVYTPKKRYSHHEVNGKRIYGTYRWRKLSQRLRNERPLCERCLTLGLTNDAVLVDHRHELKDGGDPWDESNLECLCRACHNNKTAREAVRRKKKGPSLSDF